MKNVVIGFLGSQLDSGGAASRWEKWRPTVAICQHEDLLIERLELLYSGQHVRLAHQVKEDIASVSPETEVRLHRLEARNPWDFQEVYGLLHEFARTYEFRTESERYFMHITTGTHVAQICMFLLTETRYFPASLLQTSPGKTSRRDAIGTYSIIDLDLSRYDQIAARFARERQESTDFLKSGIPTRNPPFNRMIESIERVAIRSRAPLLLIGPTGAGKSQLASRIYELKKVKHQLKGEFVEVNCATLRGDAAMSTLFGHVKGAFTGAQSDRAGLLRKANQGIVFLDEIGELGRDEQAMLLKAIEEKSFFPLGSDKEIRSDFQLIAGTNRDLRDDVQHGRFREDLLARINLWTFRLPALRERREDIEPNIDYELERFAQLNSATVRFNAEARAAYVRFATGPDAEWSGNFRELSASVSRLATLADGGRISQILVQEEIDRLRATWRPVSAEGLEGVLSSQQIEALDLFDRLQLQAVLEVCRRSNSLADAGRKLFAATRSKRSSVNDSDRLRKFLGRFDLNWDRLDGG